MSASIKYLIWGVLFGSLFPTWATLLTVTRSSCSIIEAHKHFGAPLIYLLDFAPILFGLLFYLQGRKHQLMKEKITEELMWEKQKTIAQMAVTFGHQINNNLTVAAALMDELIGQCHSIKGQNKLKKIYVTLENINNIVSTVDALKDKDPKDINIVEYIDGIEMIDIPKKAS